MAKVHPAIDSELKEWIEKQPVYFVASAPLEKDGHVNISPRGLDSFRITGENEVAMLDLTGSGNETAAHLNQNGRMTVMFCAFENSPRILRLYGTGKVLRNEQSEWEKYRSLFETDYVGVRQIFVLAIERIQTSCGYGVPLMSFEGQRELLSNWARQRGEEGIAEYQKQKNSYSIDGLPAPGLAEKSAD